MAIGGKGKSEEDQVLKQAGQVDAPADSSVGDTAVAQVMKEAGQGTDLAERVVPSEYRKPTDQAYRRPASS